MKKRRDVFWQCLAIGAVHWAAGIAAGMFLSTASAGHTITPEVDAPYDHFDMVYPVEDQTVTLESLIAKVEMLQAEMVKLKSELADVQDEVEESYDSPFLRAPRVVTDQ